MEKEQNQNLENSTSEEKGNGEDEQKETSIISKKEDETKDLTEEKNPEERILELEFIVNYFFRTCSLNCI